MATDLNRTAITAISSTFSLPSSLRGGLKWHPSLVAILIGLGASCTGETGIPIDLGSTTVPVVESSTIPAALNPVNPNEDQNRVAVGYAEQQCLDDPDLGEGYVRIVVPDTEEIVGEITVDCEQVRAAATGSE